MRVLAGGPTREVTSEMFRLHVDCLRAQASPSVEVEVRHEVVEDEGGARWTGGKIERVARCRQGFLDAGLPVEAVDGDQSWWGRFDAVLMVDTDVMLGPDVLSRMLAVDAPVVYGVFWTLWPGFNRPLPQVWDAHPYAYTPGKLEELSEDGVNEVRVFGGGACTLIRGEGLRARYWPLLGGLKHSGGMWCGEDRTFNLCCEVLGVDQVAVTGLPIAHLYSGAARSDMNVQATRRALWGEAL